MNQKKWWGWGEINKDYSLKYKPNFWPFLEKKIGISLTKDYPPVNLSKINLPKPNISQSLLSSLQNILGNEDVKIDKFERIIHSCGKSYRDLIALRSGNISFSPDYILYPNNLEELKNCINLVAEKEGAIIPFGGGTSVVGGVEPLKGNKDFAVTIDLAKLNNILKIDKDSMTALIQAGIKGPDLEHQLGKEGFTLGHFPQSFEFSTLGGWVATRSAGQQSTLYGKIEDMVMGLSLVSPNGIYKIGDITPASATGPNLLQMIVGSEGIYGVISEITIKIRPIPESKIYMGLIFKNFEDGLNAVKTFIQEGFYPATVRLSDEDETETAFSLRSEQSEFKELLKNIGLTYLNSRGYSFENGSFMVLGFEGTENKVKYESKEVIKICEEFGGFNLGTSPGKEWYKERFEHPYLRDTLLDKGILTDTLETATIWSNIPKLYQEVKKAIKNAIENTGSKGIVMCHLSHVYHTGTSLYFTFLANQKIGSEIEQWKVIKESASEAISSNNGTISHHHGVGIDHNPWIKKEHGINGINMMKALKTYFDPNKVMNPEKLIPAKII